MNTAFLLLNASKKLKYTLNHAMENHGLTTQQWAVIQRIGQSQNEDVVTAIQLSRLLDIDKQTLSGIIKRLEEEQLITRKPLSNDRRAFSLHLSNAAKDLAIYTTVSDEVLEQFLSPLTDNEKVTLNNLLSKLQ